MFLEMFHTERVKGAAEPLEGESLPFLLRLPQEASQSQVPLQLRQVGSNLLGTAFVLALHQQVLTADTRPPHCHRHHAVTVITLSQSSHCHSHHIVTAITLSQSSHCNSHNIVTVITLSQSSHCNSHHIVTVITLSQSPHCNSHHIVTVITLNQLSHCQ